MHSLFNPPKKNKTQTKKQGGESAGKSIAQRVDLFFQDADMIPLLVQENYVNHRPLIAVDQGTRLRALAKAADAISAGDTVNAAVRRHQQWSLMPFAGVVGTLLPAAYMRGPRETFDLYPGEQVFVGFFLFFFVVFFCVLCCCCFCRASCHLKL